MKEVLFGERIKLCRPICNSETAEAIYTVINKCKEAFIPWLGWGTNYRKEDALSFLETADIDWNNNSQFVYAIYLENTFIGLVSVLNVAWQHKRAEIFYLVFPPIYDEEPMQNIFLEKFPCVQDHVAFPNVPTVPPL